MQDPSHSPKPSDLLDSAANPSDQPGRLELTVQPHEGGMRLDAFLASRVADFSRARATEHLQQGRVTLLHGPRSLVDKLARGSGNLKASLQVQERMAFAIVVQPRAQMSAAPEQMPLRIVYEDADLLVVDKPAGLVVHPAAGHETGTLVNALLWHAPEMEGVGDEETRPGLVHRIDKDTSGLLVVSKSDLALRKLGADFAAHRVERRYAAILLGQLPGDELTIRTLHGRHPSDRKKFSGRVKEGKPAVTHLTVLARSALTTLVQCRLETGRTHQIRVHVAERGYPIAGDALYGGQRPLPKTPRTAGDARWLGEVTRQALHAYALGFVHPRTGEHLRFVLDWPDDLRDVAHGLYGDAAALPGFAASA